MLGSMSQWAAGLGNANQAIALSQHTKRRLPTITRTPPTAGVRVTLVEATAHASQQDAPATLAGAGQVVRLPFVDSTEQRTWPPGRAGCWSGSRSCGRTLTINGMIRTSSI